MFELTELAALAFSSLLNLLDQASAKEQCVEARAAGGPFAAQARTRHFRKADAGASAVFRRS